MTKPNSDDAKPVDAPEESVADKPIDQPPGCLPGLIAATLLMGIAAFITCGVTTWVLFQKRTEFAVRTLKGQVEVIEQSLLEPDDKKSVIAELNSTIEKMSVDDYPPAEAAAIMERLVRLPMAQWGELSAIESFITKSYPEDQRDNALKQISRMRRAVEIDRATVIDVNDALMPVTTNDLNAPLGRTLNQPLSLGEVDDVVQRAKLVGDRGEVPDRIFPNPTMGKILKSRLNE